MPLTAERDIALQAVTAACSLCRKVQAGSASIRALTKDDKSPVTVADLGSQAVICHTLGRTLPGDPIVAEEDSDMLRRNQLLRDEVFALARTYGALPDTAALCAAIDAGRTDPDFGARYWTLDPIDGTKGFLRGEQYAIALALIEEGRIVLGVLGCPNFPVDQVIPDASGGALLYALRGSGAWITPLGGGAARQIATDGCAAAQARFCESVERAHAAHEEHARIAALMGITAEPYRIDSQAKYAAVACGLASVYLRLPRTRAYREKIWDHAAGALLVAEAGGRVSDFSGADLDLTAGRSLVHNEGILATNGALHASALAAIRQVCRLPRD